MLQINNTHFWMNVLGMKHWLHIANSSMKSWKLKIAAIYDCYLQFKIVNLTLVTISKQLLLYKYAKIKQRITLVWIVMPNNSVNS